MSVSADSDGCPDLYKIGLCEEYLFDLDEWGGYFVADKFDIPFGYNFELLQHF